MTRPGPRLTLGQFIALGFAALTLVLLVLLSVFETGSRRTILLASEQLMRQASRRVAERLDGHLGEAERLVAALESAAAFGLLSRATAESVLIGALGGHPQVTDVTLTYGRALGIYTRDEPPHEAGELRLAPAESGQVAVARTAANADGILVRRLLPGPDGWRAELIRVASDGGREPIAPATGDAAPMDPTTHPTFTTPARPDLRGRALWSDLAFFEADAALPEAERRRVVSVQKALWTPAGDFAGVVRVALQSDRIDELTHITVDETASEDDDHVVFLCDRFGRLITRLASTDRFGLLDRRGEPDAEDGDVRVVTAAVPAPVSAALAAPAIRAARGRDPMVSRLDVGGVSYLASVAPLLGERTQGWLVGIVVPESHYLAALEASRRRVLGVAFALVLAAAAGAGLGLRAMRRDLRRLIGETIRLRSFDFRPSAGDAATFRDVQEAARSLEQAKTALRALGKYVPLDLVRDLYDAHREPVLGAELQDVTLLFSDVAGFTTIAEMLDPDTLATALGAYLETLTRAVHASGGVIDKYTGDGVMALWNAPRPIAGHPARACAAALACLDATRTLFASPAWRGLDPWPTRFGIHRAAVKVGHFGAPDRLSFTAMGDGVNVASRLEGLGKHYGVAIIVSAAVEREARDAFWFRRLDRVAVKGRHDGIDVYELLARRVPGERPPVFVAPYEAALAAYGARRFADAVDLLRTLPDDAPSRVLAARCRDLLRRPPNPDWSGVHVASVK